MLAGNSIWLHVNIGSILHLFHHAVRIPNIHSYLLNEGNMQTIRTPVIRSGRKWIHEWITCFREDEAWQDKEPSESDFRFYFNRKHAQWIWTYGPMTHVSLSRKKSSHKKVNYSNFKMPQKPLVFSSFECAHKMYELCSIFVLPFPLLCDTKQLELQSWSISRFKNKKNTGRACWKFFFCHFAIIETFSYRCWVQASFPIDCRMTGPIFILPFLFLRYDMYAVRPYASLNADVYKQKDKTI